MMDVNQQGVHDTHCFQGEYADGCKYGPNEQCLALPKKWPHSTYDNNGRPVWVTKNGDTYRDDQLEVEYWTITGDWTASGENRFIKVTKAPQYGQHNVIVKIRDGQPIASEVHFYD